MTMCPIPVLPFPFPKPTTPKEASEASKEFPTTEEDQTQFFLFSPFIIGTDDPFLEQMLLALVAVKVAKTPEGLKVLRDLGIEYLRTIGKTLVALEDASTSNWVNCLLNQKLSMRVMRRLGLLTNTDYNTLNADYNQILKWVLLKEGITDTFQALGSFAKGVSGLIPALK